MNVLFFVQPGINSRQTLLDLMRGFERCGHRVIHWDLEPMWLATARAGADTALKHRLMSEFTAMVRSTITHNRIDLTVAMWANALTSLTAAAGPDGRVQSLFDILDLPHVCYWLDAPHWAHEGIALRLIASSAGDLLRSRRIHHVINDPATAAEMRDLMGFVHVHPLSYGINEHLFAPRDLHPEFDVMLAVGPGDPPPTPLALDLLDAREIDFEPLRRQAARDVRPRLAELAGRLATGPHDHAPAAIVDRLLASQLTHRHTPMLARLQGLIRDDPGLVGCGMRLCRDLPLYVELTSAIRSIESAERAFTFAALCRRFRGATFGPGGEALNPWLVRGPGAAHLGMLDWSEQSAAYSQARIGLNVMRWQDDCGLNVKPYEITASGAACLQARRVGIDRLFEPDREIAVFDGPAQAVTMCESLLSDDARRNALARAGRARTLRDHTWTAVAERLVRGIADSGAAPARRAA